MPKIWCFIIFFVFALFSNAQEYHITTFRAGDGLKTDMISIIFDLNTVTNNHASK